MCGRVWQKQLLLQLCWKCQASVLDKIHTLALDNATCPDGVVVLTSAFDIALFSQRAGARAATGLLEEQRSSGGESADVSIQPLLAARFPCGHPQLSKIPPPVRWLGSSSLRWMSRQTKWRSRCERCGRQLSRIVWLGKSMQKLGPCSGPGCSILCL